MKKLIYLIIIVLLLGTTGCPSHDTIDVDIYVVNHSENDIFFSLGIQRTRDKLCPDNLIPPYKEGKVIERGHKDRIGLVGYIPECDSIKIFILNADTVNVYAWEQIRNENKILKRYDLTFSILKKMNWTVTYPL